MIFKKFIALFCIGLLVTNCATSGVISRSDGSLSPDPGKRSFGSFIDDRQLIEVVQTNLDSADHKFFLSNINVYSFNQVILLTGEVPTEALKARATQIAKKVHLVRGVHNELQVAPNASFMSRANDNWIHNKIIAKLISEDNIEANRVEVIVENEVVYLMGLLRWEEAEIVTDLVRYTNGVNRVVRAIEYID